MTEEELFEMMEEGGVAERGQNLVRHWLKRGDGVAVYRNEAMDHSQHGHVEYVSFGSEQAQLEPQYCDEAGSPPKRLPDVGNQINWPYQLVGTVRRGT